MEQLVRQKNRMLESVHSTRAVLEGNVKPVRIWHSHGTVNNACHKIPPAMRRLHAACTNLAQTDHV